MKCAGFFLALVLAAACEGADTYVVAGVVVNSQTGSVIPHAQVTLLVYGGTRLAGNQVTGDNGRFSFEVPKGVYRLLAGPRNWQVVYGTQSGSGFGTSVITAPGQDTSGLVFQWYPPTAIAGRVLDEGGEPAEGVRIQLLRSSVVAGRRMVATYAWAHSDDLGEYRFGPLAAGTYYLAATGQPWYSGRSSGGARDQSAPVVAYIPTYYRGGFDFESAIPLTVRAGEEARADFNMMTTQGARVTVKHDAPEDFVGSVGLTMTGIGGMDGYQRSERLYPRGGQHTFAAVPPGRYVVRVAGSRANRDFLARQSVQVNGSDIMVEVNLQPQPTVSGTVQLKRPDVKPRGSLLVTLVRENAPGTIGTAVRADGSFEFPTVVVGKYRPIIGGTSGLIAAGVETIGADFRDGVLDLTEGSVVRLRMQASDEVGRVQGFVMEGERIVPGVLVVLAPVVASTDYTEYRGFQTDSDGSFDYKLVRAGDYFLFAVGDLLLEYANPKAIRPYLGQAKRIRVEPNGVNSETIPVSTATAIQ